MEMILSKPMERGVAEWHVFDPVEYDHVSMFGTPHAPQTYSEFQRTLDRLSANSRDAFRGMLDGPLEDAYL